jgi:hypothetical protein
MKPPNANPVARVDEQPAQLAAACAIGASPFTAEELSLLDRLLALKNEWRDLTGRLNREPVDSPEAPAPDATGDAAAARARLREIDIEARRLRRQAASARLRRMIALGHVESGDTPLVLVSELRLGPPTGPDTS